MVGLPKAAVVNGAQKGSLLCCNPTSRATHGISSLLLPFSYNWGSTICRTKVRLNHQDNRVNVFHILHGHGFNYKQLPYKMEITGKGNWEMVTIGWTPFHSASLNSYKGTPAFIYDSAWHRGNTYLTSLPVSARHHGRVNSVKIEINFTSSASSIFLVHNLYCDKCI